ncbi:2-oxo-hepta-3-ene-1,7-dioic acid hydratase [Salmonella enterica subsp. arizonae]|uniref:2-oxo-hepta-3-ene-1,7-dioic acid hydratase n=1 Tax=Salmonella enterica subsp. arizonae TaxID=59203 RepID=A0A379S4L2_SALER|nr:2-oxo-hepta-3-ene-1,7-dioic acid hydratase [Salmonella enterica subsp. arizonae]
MLDKQTHTLIAQRLNQAEKQREQIRASVVGLSKYHD